ARCELPIGRYLWQQRVSVFLNSKMLIEQGVDLSWICLTDRSMCISAIYIDPFAVDVMISRDGAHGMLFATTCLSNIPKPFSSSVILVLSSCIRNITHNTDAIGWAMLTRKIGAVLYKLFPCIVVN